jgi:phosphoglycolate phosphatase
MINILFDLDGTLLNTHEGIQHSFDYAYLKTFNNKNKINLSNHIGPPIDEILIKLIPNLDQKIINLFVDNFKANYDHEGYLKSKIYDGTFDLLNTLQSQNYQIFLCTNKRENPTKKLLSNFNITNFFTEVFCLNKEQNSNKESLIKSIILLKNLNPNNTFYVGDTKNDEISSINNKIEFIYAKYGFDQFSTNAKFISKPLDLLHFFK